MSEHMACYKEVFKSSPFACCTLRAHFPWSPLKTQINNQPSAIWQNKGSELPLNIRQNCQSHACCSWHLKSYWPHYDIFTQPNLKPLLYCSALQRKASYVVNIPQRMNQNIFAEAHSKQWLPREAKIHILGTFITCPEFSHFHDISPENDLLRKYLFI